MLWLWDLYSWRLQSICKKTLRRIGSFSQGRAEKNTYFETTIRILDPPIKGFEPEKQGCFGPQNDATFEGPMILRALVFVGISISKLRQHAMKIANE